MHRASSAPARRRPRGGRAPRAAIPATSPPPPTGTRIVSTSGASSTARARPCPARRSRPGRRTDGRACGRSPRSARSRRSNASAGIVGLEVDRRAVAARRGDLRGARAAPHDDERVEPSAAAPQASACAWLPAEMPITPRALLLGRQRREPVEHAARLEGAGASGSSSALARPRPERRRREGRRPVQAAARSARAAREHVVAAHGHGRRSLSRDAASIRPLG